MVNEVEPLRCKKLQEVLNIRQHLRYNLPMTLSIEVYHPDRKEWIKLPEWKPGDLPGSVSQDKPDGTREVYLFECASDDFHSTIYRSTLGVDTEVGSNRILTTEGLEEIATLRRGDRPHILTLLTDISSQRRVIRFTHK